MTRPTILRNSASDSSSGSTTPGNARWKSGSLSTLFHCFSRLRWTKAVRVSPSSRAVLLLHYQQHLSLEEAAAILDIPVGTAKSRLAYGLTTLRKFMKEQKKP